jgi:hypothetical protein
MLTILLAAALGFVLVTVCVEWAARRRASRDAAAMFGEALDASIVVKRSPKRLALPRAYPGETPNEYQARLGIPDALMPSTAGLASPVWSDIRGAWVEMPACGLADKSPMPIDGEAVADFIERREREGWFAGRSQMPPEWRWSAASSSFVPPTQAAPAVVAEV